MSDQSAPAGRFDRLDAMRGVACLTVLFAHCASDVRHSFAPGTWQATVPSLLIDRFEMGRFGVILFFFISGFVIPFSLRGPRPLARFARSRFFRLYPMFWLGLVLALTEGLALEGQRYSLAQIAANATMLPVPLHQAYVTGIYWTLALELQFYAVCAGLCCLGLLERPLVLFAAGAAFVALPVTTLMLRHTGHHAPLLYPQSFVGFMFAGTLVRRWYVQHERGSGALAVVLVLVLVGLCPVFAAEPDGLFTVSTAPGALAATVAAAALFGAAVVAPVAMPRWLVGAGLVSYSVYLTHDTVIKVISHLLPAHDDAAIAVLFLAATLVTVLLSLATWRWVEQPMIALGRTGRQA